MLVLRYETFMLALCVLIVAFSVVATFGNLLAIRALWKASTIPNTLTKLFLSLAVSDLTMGLFAQLMFGVILAKMLNMAASGNFNFEFYCPYILSAAYFFLFLLACASFLNVTAIAVDRLLAISLHLRYQEIVTPKRVIITLVFLWFTSGIAASIFTSLPNRNSRVSNIIEFVGLFVTAAVYFRIYKVARYHQNQIQNQWQLQNGQTMAVLREKKSAINVLFFYAVFLVSYLPHLCCSILLLYKDIPSTSFQAAHEASLFLVLLNSSLNPLVYCWRYREIREIMKSTAKSVICITLTG
ncbi:histamine H2 receptor-like [Oculina patagonica]